MARRNKMKQWILAVILFCALCVLPLFANAQDIKDGAMVTEGTTVQNSFLMDNVLSTKKHGDIHYHLHLPEDYAKQGGGKYALLITLPGWEGLYFQGMGENLRWESFGQESIRYNKEMIVVAPQLNDWGVTSAEQTIVLTKYFLASYPIDPKRVYIDGYSGGGETLSLVLEREP